MTTQIMVVNKGPKSISLERGVRDGMEHLGNVKPQQYLEVHIWSLQELYVRELNDETP